MTGLCGEQGYLTRSTERLPESGEHRQIGVKRYALKSSHAKRPEPVVVLQAAEFALDRTTATVEPLPLIGAVRDRSERHGPSLPQTDDRDALPLATLVVDAAVVVALVHGARLGAEAAFAGGVKERRGEQTLVPLRRLDAPYDGEIGVRANRRVNLVAIESSSRARRHSRTMPPRRIGVAEPLALGAARVDVPLPVCERGKIARVDGDVAAVLRSSFLQRGRDAVQTVREGGLGSRGA